MIRDRDTKPVSTIISTPDSLLDALTKLLMRSTIPVACGNLSPGSFVRTPMAVWRRSMSSLSTIGSTNGHFSHPPPSCGQPMMPRSSLKMDSVSSSPIWSFCNCCSAVFLPWVSKPTPVPRSLERLRTLLSNRQRTEGQSHCP